MASYRHSQILTLSNFGVLSGELAEKKAKLAVQLRMREDEYLPCLNLISPLIAFMYSTSDKVY